MVNKTTILQQNRERDQLDKTTLTTSTLLYVFLGVKISEILTATL